MNVILIAVISLGAIALVAAVMPMLASRQVRWKVNFVRWADSLS